MRLQDIRSRGFYTDGTDVFYNENGRKNGRIIVFTEPFSGNRLFLKTGVETAYYHGDKDKEVRLVEPGEEFMNGHIRVKGPKELEIRSIQYKGRKINSRGETVNASEIEYVPYWETIRYAEI